MKIDNIKIEEEDLSYNENNKIKQRQITCSVDFTDDDGKISKLSNRAVVPEDAFDYINEVRQAAFSELFKEISYTLLDKLKK